MKLIFFNKIVYHLMMKKVLFFLLFLAGFFGLLITSQPVWPKYLSFQRKIDPETLTDEYDPLATVGVFDNKQVVVPKDQLSILGETTEVNNSNKYIDVDLTNQKVYTYENGIKLKEYLISSGKWGRTPIGTFKIWIKLRSQKMEGGSKLTGDYYYLPNVPYILFFYNDDHPKTAGFSLHGTYWHHNFGVPMSHGCINMITADAAEVFNWADVGTEVRIYGKYEYNKKTAMR